ncbi:hypothetical protein CISG_10368 [Coccidioides immitis RMSCC 3703]|uniref:Uncharacterized protein n=1 Tax=Coccidioides immitis RMSCC 3703 TaxID=454286 RepID=A0A0J8QSB2_COCIT|nr:hypothetical protein CISG_10368 [Coccidioides immitis RMSCC 3703]
MTGKSGSRVLRLPFVPVLAVAAGSLLCRGTSQIPAEQRESMQVLSQVNYYMEQHDARYSYVLSNTELVPIKRLEASGNLLVAHAIPWETKGPEQLVVLLGLWYLWMLSTADDDWQIL